MGSERNLPCAPLITYKIVIFRDAKTWTLFSNSQSAFIYLTYITGHVEILKGFSNYQNEQKTDFSQDPLHPNRSRRFLAGSVSFFNRFF